jgi:hypothetical protein
LNVNIHHQWASLLALHMNSKSQIPIYNNASSGNFEFNNEKTHCTPTYLIIHKFQDAPKMMDHENTIYFIAPTQYFHPLSLFKDNHLEKPNFPTLFYGQL